MGRGRQKAKQAKVARELKYFSPDTDYSALQRELAGSGGSHPPLPAPVSDELDDDVDEYDSDDDDPDGDTYLPPPRTRR